MKGRIAVLLDGSIGTDARVQRTTDTLSSIFDHVDLFYFSKLEQEGLNFSDNVTLKNLYGLNYKKSWFTVNFRINKLYPEFEEELSSDLKYDAIWCNDYVTLSYGIALKKRNPNIKLIYDSHEIYIETFNQFFPSKGWTGLFWKLILILYLKPVHTFNEKKYLKIVDFFITVNNSLSDYFDTNYGRKAIVVRNVPTKRKLYTSNILKVSCNLNLEDKIVLYQGNMNDGRGLEELLQSLKYLPKNYHLVLIGDGPLKMELISCSKKKDYKERIHFLNEVAYEELHNYTLSADVGVLILKPVNVSKRLASANKIFEYMAAGIPVVATDLPENRRVIVESQCGVLIDDPKPKTIADGILSVEEKHGLNGFNRFLDTYNWEKELVIIKEILK